MDRVFKKCVLYDEGSHGKESTLPLSLPLILPSYCSYNRSTQEITENRDYTLDDRGSEFWLVPETVRILESISKPVAVVSICGPYRSGKSYFLSRLLGNEETFKLGHTMHACTQGVWMASTVLECEEFALILLDTEGIDAMDKGKSGVTNMLVFIVMLSSLFIYNSKNVPRAKDLKKMSCLSAISRLMDGDTIDRNKHNLPDFMWLLRDVDSIPTDSVGKEITPTEFIVKILQNSRSLASSTLLNFFPSLHCLTIPPPSSDGALLSDITRNCENLSPCFKESIDAALQYILSNIKVKMGYNSALKLNGSMLACLVKQYFQLIKDMNCKLPIMEVSWLMTVELRLKRIAEALIDEYDRDMRAQLREMFPMPDGLQGETGETLMNVHLQVFAKKRLQLQTEILSHQSHPLTERITSMEISLLNMFDEGIVEYDKTDKNKVIGGKLFIFIKENYTASEELCNSLYKKIYDETVYHKLQNALFTQIPTTIDPELATFRKEYFKKAKGEAIYEVYKRLRSESSTLEGDLLLIPGPVENLNVVGVDADRVKLRWEPPEINQSAAELYEILIKSKGKDWEVISTREGHSVLVTGLKSSTWYCLSVRAKNQRFRGNKVQFVRVQTLVSKSLQKAVKVSSIAASPIVYPCMVAYAGSSYISRGIQAKSPIDVLGGGLMLTMVPVTALIGMTPVIGALASNDTYNKEIRNRRGDLSDKDTSVVYSNGEALSTFEVVDVPEDSENEIDLCSSGRDRQELQDICCSSDESG